MLPMGKLVKYMSVLTELYGSVENVHFDSVSEGSAELNAWVDNEASYNAVIERSILNAQSNGTQYQRLVNLLEEDGFSGKLLDGNKSVLIHFHTSKKEPPLFVSKIANVQGRLYSVGGKDNSIPVRIEGANGETYRCEATPEIAAYLGGQLFQQVRVTGESLWERKDNRWKLKKLKISSYEVIKKTKLKDAIKSLSKASGNQWSDEDDCNSILNALRAMNCE